MSAVATRSAVTLRELEADADVTKREEDEAMAAWRALGERETALTGPPTRMVAGRRIRRADGSERDPGRHSEYVMIEIDGVPRRVADLDEVTRSALFDEIAGQRGDAARRVKAARTRHAEAKRRLAAAQLDAASPVYETAAATLVEAKRQAEHALAAAAAAVLQYGVARKAARNAARSTGSSRARRRARRRQAAPRRARTGRTCGPCAGRLR